MEHGGFSQGNGICSLVSAWPVCSPGVEGAAPLRPPGLGLGVTGLFLASDTQPLPPHKTLIRSGLSRGGCWPANKQDMLHESGKEWIPGPDEGLQLEARGIGAGTMGGQHLSQRQLLSLSYSYPVNFHLELLHLCAWGLCSQSHQAPRWLRTRTRRATRKKLPGRRRTSSLLLGWH